MSETPADVPVAAATPDASTASASSTPSANPRVFFDITIGGSPAGRIVMELFKVRIPTQYPRFIHDDCL